MPVYLDHAATTPARPQAIEAFISQSAAVGNPSSVHSAGQKTRQSLEEARESLAESLGAHRSEIIFTSGGTEANNLGVKGLYLGARNLDAKRKIVVSAGTEHHAVIEPIEYLEQHEGAEVVMVPVSAQGELDLDWLKQFLADRGDEVALITLMWANNETGVIWPVEEVAKLGTSRGIAVHSDAVAAFGHLKLNFEASGLTAISVSGHKVGSPVGIGALVLARDAKLAVLSHGGGQERGVRSGTLSAPLIKSFAVAAALAVAEIDSEHARLSQLADKLIAGILTSAPTAEYSRGSSAGLPGTVHFLFAGCSGDSLLFLLDAAGVAVSTGSACRAGVAQASHVLMAMGRTEAEARGSLRISLGYSTSESDIDAFVAAFPAAYSSAKQAGLPSK